MTHNFKIVGGDTDSIMFCKPDMTSFSEEEQEKLLQEINSLLPTEIKFANDGIFRRVVYAKAKNYVMQDFKGKLKVKGSAFKSSTLEPILKQMLTDFVNVILEPEVFVLEDCIPKLQEIYMKYVLMVPNIKDIKLWCTKKTLSATTYASQRKNETDIVDAVRDSEYVEGDKVYLFATLDEKWCLAEKFEGSYSWDTYYEKIFKTAARFSTILDTKTLFPNYSLKGNQKKLHEELGIQNPKPVPEKKPRGKKEKSSTMDGTGSIQSISAQL
jgi:hypothetical protein